MKCSTCMKTFVVVESVSLVELLLAEVTGILLDPIVHIHVVLGRREIR